MDSSSVIALTAQTLVESGCLERCVFFFDQGLPFEDSGDSGQTRHDATHVQNAVKLALMLTRSFVQWYDENNFDALEHLQLDNFVVKLQCAPDADAEGGGILPAKAGNDRFMPITTVDEFNEIMPTDQTQLVLLGIDIPYSEPQTPNNMISAPIGTDMETIGKLLRGIFIQKDAPVPDEVTSNIGQQAGGGELVEHASKIRRSVSKSLFERLIESGYPISVCRLLNDLTERGDTSHPITSFDDVMHELDKMNTHPHIYLHNPENGFITSSPHFGQRYYGRSKELAKLLEITTVPKESDTCLEVIFVSGIAGSGKTHLVSAVASFMSGLGFSVLKAKFKRGMEYTSREIVSSLFDEMVGNLVEMRDSASQSDIDYSHRATQAISNALDTDSLSSLENFVPSIQKLIPKASRTSESKSYSHWQVIFLLSKLLRSVLSLERKILISMDDLHWADGQMLRLMSELLTSICHHPEERQQLVFVGMYREDEVTDDLELFTSRFHSLVGENRVNLTEMKLSALSLDDVIEMTMSELRLPRRLVSELSLQVQKKAFGHAIFVVQLLNTMVSDSTIAYSPRSYRFDWDQDSISVRNVEDNVAGLIVSNLKALPVESLQTLRIISCFGIQVQLDLLGLLEFFRLAPKGGFDASIGALVNQGIIETVGPLVAFTHDLIQEQVYEDIPGKERQQMHLDIGIYLGSKTDLDSSPKNKPLHAAIEQLYLSDVSDNEDSYYDVASLVSIATSQINAAGSDTFVDQALRTRFSSWNLHAGKDASEVSNFRAALYFYKYGIAFLGEHAWQDDTYDISLRLHEGATFASSALAETEQVAAYVNDIISNATTFEDSLVAQYLLICSITASGQYQEAIARGLAVLRQLKFDIPATPNPMALVQKMEQTEKEALMYDFNHIDNYHKVGHTTRNVMKIGEAISVACFHVASPLLPLVACETVRFSLRNGICEQSATAYIVFAYFQVLIMRSFDRSRHWGIIAKNMLERASSEGLVIRARFLLVCFVNFWFVPMQDTRDILEDIHYSGLKVGETEVAYMAKCMNLRFSFFRGDQLSTLSNLFCEHLHPMVNSRCVFICLYCLLYGSNTPCILSHTLTKAKFSIGSAKLSAADKDLIDELTGDKSDNPYSVLGSTMCTKESLLSHAKSNKHLQIVEAVHLQNFFVSFWMGDYAEAEKASAMAMSFPSAKMPKVHLICHIFFRGIVAFHLYREGKGDKWLVQGKEMLDQVEAWAENSKPIFENKLILLEAEYYASMCNVVAAKESYELSIKVARDNGYIHEQGLAYECMGKYLTSNVEVLEGERCFMSAHRCYTQWGAIAKADKLWKEHDLDSSAENIEFSSIKHQRD